MRYMKISRFDTANGPGIRTVLWVSGCTHHCKGCHNPETWNPSLGKAYTEETIKEILDSLNSDYITGLTLSGGDPLHYLNMKKISELILKVKNSYPNKSIWLYTGYKWEDILEESKSSSGFDLRMILNDIDVLVDGKFMLNQKDISLPYCGSSNQRVIDVKESLSKNKVILYKED